MLPLDRFRALLPPGTEMSDDDLKRLVDQLYVIASVAVEQALAGRRKSRGGEPPDGAPASGDKSLPSTDLRPTSRSPRARKEKKTDNGGSRSKR